MKMGFFSEKVYCNSSSNVLIIHTNLHTCVEFQMVACAL
jgi:hypothetical protein